MEGVLMSDGAEREPHSDSNILGGKVKKVRSYLDGVPQHDPGPGELGLQLSIVNEHLRDLGTEDTLSHKEHELYRLFYAHERNKLQLRLTVLEKREKVQFSEGAYEKVRKALELAQSEGGQQKDGRKSQTRLAGSSLDAGTKNPYGLSQIPEHSEEDEIRKLEILEAQAEASLAQARSELETALTALQGLCPDRSDWEDRKTAVRRWELSRQWEAITPDELRPAVKAIRYTFEDHCWHAQQSTMKLCYAALHPESSIDAASPSSRDLEPYKRFLTVLVGPRVQGSLLGHNHPAPVIFKSYFDVLETALKVVVGTSFREIYEIAKARAELLNLHPVEWAKRHMENLIYGRKVGVTIWIRQVCDYPHTLQLSCDDDIYGGAWRAPRLMHTLPVGNAPYDPVAAWTREGLVASLELLEALSNRMTTLVSFELDKVVRAAHVEFVKEAGLFRKSKRLEADEKGREHAENKEKLARDRISSTVPSTGTAEEVFRSDNNSAKNRSHLGGKKQDLSQYLDSAKLTQRQHECMSLHFEYALKLTEIAHRLGIDRKTVEEHLALARAKLEKQTARGRHQKNLAKVKPGGLDM